MIKLSTGDITITPELVVPVVPDPFIIESTSSSLFSSTIVTMVFLVEYLIFIVLPLKLNSLFSPLPIPFDSKNVA